MFNVSATVNVSRLLYNPSLCLPHATARSFDLIKFPLSIPGHPDAQIKGVVLDKDNCVSKDHDDKIWPGYKDAWKTLQDSFPKEHLLIVSNSAGTNDDVDYQQALKLEKETGVTVLRHPTKKPGCHNEIQQYFDDFGIKSHEIIVIGDRLFTDMLMANMMGSWGLWLSHGVEKSEKIFPRFERLLYDKLVTNRPDDVYYPPTPNEAK